MTFWKIFLKGLKFSYQNNILSILAIKRLRQTNVENPSAFFVLLMSRYCGIKGKTPPNIIAPAATVLTRFFRVKSGITRNDRIDKRASAADWTSWATGLLMSTIGGNDRTSSVDYYKIKYITKQQQQECEQNVANNRIIINSKYGVLDYFFGG